MKSLYIVCYDISNNKIRGKIEKAISGFGQRVQYSVFECILSVKDKNEMIKKLKDIFLNSKKVDKNIDSIRIYRLCKMCRGNIQKFGADKSINESYMII